MSSSLRSERNKALYKLWDLIFLVRPPLLCASCVFFFSGVAASKSSSIISSTNEMRKALSNLILFVLITSIAFVVNQILDVESDRLNKKVFIMPLNLVRRSEAVVFALVLILAVIALSYKRALFEVALVWSGVGLGVLYSLPPVRLKSIPIADVASNSIGFGWIGFTLGWLSLAPFDGHALVLSSAYAIGMAGIFLNTLIEDEDGDRIVGDRTT
ncbi:MAG: UbiA family prenyltransferase, partial [bacterium]